MGDEVVQEDQGMSKVKRIDNHLLPTLHFPGRGQQYPSCL